MNHAELFADLRNKIVWLDLEPESILNHVELARHYGVSRTPIVIALNRLEVEGWVVRHGTHFVVSPLTLDRMRDITELRMVLEPQANIWTMYRMSGDSLAKLHRIKDEIAALDPEAGNKEIVRLDVRFHELLYRESHNTQVGNLLTNLLHHYLRFWLAAAYRIDKDAFFSEALEIIRAVEEKDEVRLRAASAEHIKVSLDLVMRAPGM
ncbi:MAG: GntR family transcriptional regulator [Desulfarculaceae bacterium]|jgi:DNA-binding GntR family transcriptional regulator